MKRILLTGATGNIGAYTALALKGQGYDVIAVARNPKADSFFQSHGIPFYRLDVTDAEGFQSLPTDVDTVLHCANAVPSMMSGYRPQEYIDSVMTGTLNVLEYARTTGVDKIIYTQSRADSGHLQGGDAPVPSDITPSFPKTGDHAIYTICKNAAVNLIEHYHYEFGLNRFILRLPTIYSYHPCRTFYVNGTSRPMAYRLFIANAMEGKPIEMWGNPSMKKEIVYINDLIQIIQKAIESDRPGGTYNVGSGGVTLQEQIQGIIDVFSDPDHPSEIIARPEMPDARQFIHDISKTQEELGYQPQYTYRKLLEAYKEEMHLERFKELWGTEADYDADCC